MEKLMHYVWQHRLYPTTALYTVDGQPVSIINPGTHNLDAGPDFFNAAIEIGGQTWIGNVEIHVRASDWFRHGHDRDRAYDNVILHVVDNDDMIIRRSDGSQIPQLKLPCSPSLNSEFHRLADSAPVQLSCATAIQSLPKIYLTDWIEALALERLQQKADRIEQLIHTYTGDWEDTCYVTVARSLGFGKNNDPFERLARATPIRFLRKHADSILSIEAFLFGQAGFLESVKSTDPYIDRLRSEYSFLVNKFGLRRPASLGWKMARMRPHNFPYRRIALLAQMIHDGYSVMSKILDIKDADSARRIFDYRLTGYWATHYTFDSAPAPSPINLSRQSLDILVINAAVPLLYAYAMATANHRQTDTAIDILHELKPEANSIVAMFDRCGIKCSDAFSSQALIQLRRQYCEQRKCLYCRIGHRTLASCALRAH